MTRLALTAVALASSLGLAAPAFATNLVSNGGFETENIVGGVPVPPPPGWTILGDGVLIDSVFPNTGTFDIAFTALSNDPNAGVLSQVLATNPGQSLRLSFALLDEAGLSTDSFNVSLGNFSATISGDLVAPPGNLPSFYTAESFAIPGADITGGSTTLAFQGLNDPVAGIAFNLDDVSVVRAIPEPATLWLFGPALIGWGLGRARRVRLAATGSWRGVMSGGVCNEGCKRR